MSDHRRKCDALGTEVRRPFQTPGTGESEVRREAIAHRIDEAVGPASVETVLPPDVQDAHDAVVALDPRLDPADEAVAEDDRQDVPPPPPLHRRQEELPDVLEAEHVGEE